MISGLRSICLCFRELFYKCVTQTVSCVTLLLVGRHESSPSGPRLPRSSVRSSRRHSPPLRLGSRNRRNTCPHPTTRPHVTLTPGTSVHSRTPLVASSSVFGTERLPLRHDDSPRPCPLPEYRRHDGSDRSSGDSGFRAETPTSGPVLGSSPPSSVPHVSSGSEWKKWSSVCTTGTYLADMYLRVLR